jgi:phospholipase/carboxylesterase
VAHVHLRGAFLLTIGLAVGACNSPSAAPAPSPPASLERPAAAPATTPARAPVVAPLPLEVVERVTGGADPSARLPWIVAMHGLGDRPEAFGGLYASFDGKARLFLLRAPDPWGEGFSWFPFRARDGDELRAKGIAVATERVAQMLRALATTRPVEGQAIVTGFSQGGMLSFALAARHPELVRAAFPIGGALPEPLWPALDAGRAAVRLVALHGEDDELVPVGPTRAAVSALSARGRDARLETFPGVGHRIPPPLLARYLELLREELGRPTPPAAHGG